MLCTPLRVCVLQCQISPVGLTLQGFEPLCQNSHTQLINLRSLAISPDRIDHGNFLCVESCVVTFFVAVMTSMIVRVCGGKLCFKSAACTAACYLVPLYIMDV